MTVRNAESATLERRLRLAQERIAELEALQRRSRRVSGVLTRLATLADHSPSAIVELDSAVTYLNHAAREKFPGLDAMGLKHPLLSGLDEVINDMRSGGHLTRTREVSVGNSVFSQKVVLEPDSPQVSVYSDDITEDRALHNALRFASEETELLAAENALLAEIGRIIGSSLEISDVYEGFARQVRNLIPFDRTAISLVDMESFTFNNQYVFGVDAPGREEGTVVPLEGTMILRAVEENRALILQGDLEDLSRRFPMMVRSGLKSVLLAPIVFKSEVLGVLHMRSLDENAYSQHHLDLAIKVAAQIAPAIANSQLYAQHTKAEAEAKRLALQNAAIAEIGRIITGSLDIEDVYAGFAEQTRRLIGFDRIVISLLGRNSDDFTNAYVIGAPVSNRNQGDLIGLKGTFTDEVMRQQRAILFLPDSLHETRTMFPGLIPQYHSGLRSFISVPLIYKDETTGVLHFSSMKPNAYSDYEVGMADLIAAQIAGAIENSHLHAETLEADRSLQRQAEELARSNAELEQFAYVASHDLQEPLRVIAGYVNLLEERYADKLDQDARDFIGFTTDAAHRMRALINALLRYSRLETHGNPFEKMDCNRALSEAIADLEVSIDESDAEITTDALPSVVGDQIQITHVFENLISNAIKFRKDDCLPRIHISCSRAEDSWRISVADNGTGIRPRYQERIFGMFKRAHKRSKYPGTGIGLALCQKIVERHGGRIWVESEFNQGSTFHFTIPTIKEKNHDTWRQQTSTNTVGRG